MANYTVTGNRPVLGREPGETISEDELPEGQVQRLVARGQLAPAGSVQVQETTSPEPPLETGRQLEEDTFPDDEDEDGKE